MTGGAAADGFPRAGHKPASSFRLTSNFVRNSLLSALANFHLTGWLRAHTNDGGPMTDPQTRIAALVLSGTIERAAQRSQRERSEDVRVALEVAAEVLRQRAGGNPGDLIHDGPRPQPRPAPTTKERVEVKEDLAPLDQLLADRRGLRPPPKPMTTRQRTLH